MAKRHSRTLRISLFLLAVLQPRPTPAADVGRAPARLTELPTAAQAAISATLGRDDTAYHAVPQANGFAATNPRHGLAAVFTSAGVDVTSGSARWGFALQSYGYGAALKPVPALRPQASANRVEYRRGGLTEWYANGPLGLEQGFTFTAPPAKGPGPLTLALKLTGDLIAKVDAARDGLTLRRPEGPALLRYRGLAAADATGRALPAWLEVDGSRLLLRVEDIGARYPVVVDPFVQQAKLTASDAGVDDSLGVSVAISGDTVVVGAETAGNVNQGAAYVYVRLGTVWSGTLTETARLTASDGATADRFGHSVAISGDTVVVGAFQDDIGAGCPSSPCNLNQGSAYVFVRPMGGWATTSTFDAKLTASDGQAHHSFGDSVAISGDTVVVGAQFAGNVGQGSVYVFDKPGTVWSGTLTETARLTASDGAVLDRFGVSVAISGDAVVVGALGDDIVANLDDRGSAYVFVKPMGGWATTSIFDAKLTASDGQNRDFFGTSVAISSDTVVVGAEGSDIGAILNDQGSAYVFVKPVGGWATTSTFAAKLMASDGATIDRFGFSVAISGDSVVVAARQDDIGTGCPSVPCNVNQGSAYVFDKPGTVWSGTLTEAAKLIASDGATNDLFGHSVAVSDDTVVVGAPLHDISTNSDEGSAYVFGPDVVAVDIDIKPGSDPNCINPASQGRTPVAILGNSIDVLDINVSTVQIGGDAVADGADVFPARTSFKDVSGDTKTDLVLHFDTQALSAAGLLTDGNELFITGEVTNGTPIVGSGTIFLAGGPTCLD